MYEINLKDNFKLAIVGDPHISDSNPRSRVDNYFEAICTKIDYIVNCNDVIIFLGDFFDKPTISLKAMNILLAQFNKYRQKGKKLFTILGQHDIYNYNSDTLNKTALGTMQLCNAIEVVDKMKINGVYFETMPVKLKSYQPPQAPIGGHSILFGHFFYESTLDPVFSLNREWLENKGWTYIMLGHDHVPYEPLKLGSTTLLRPGALARNSGHDYNLTRKPHYYQFVVSKSKLTNLSFFEVSCKASSEVFNPAYYKNKVTSNSVFVQNLDAIMKKLSVSLGGEVVSILKILEELQTPPDMIEYIKQVYLKCNLDLT